MSAKEPCVLSVVYRNHRGEIALRRVTPGRIWYGTTPEHKEPQPLMDCFDLDKQANRTYALNDIIKWDATEEDLERILGLTEMIQIIQENSTKPKAVILHESPLPREPVDLQSLCDYISEQFPGFIPIVFRRAES